MAADVDSSLHNEPVVSFEVGPSKQIYQVHQGLLFKASRFFEAGFRVDADGNGFKEAVEKIMSLPDARPETFRHFTHWLYSGRCPPLPTNNVKARDRTFRNLVHLHNFSEKYIIEKLGTDTCEAVINVLMSEFPPGNCYTIPDDHLPLHTAVWGWKQAGHASPIRRITVWRWSLNIQSRWLNDEKDKKSLIECGEFATALLGAVAARSIPSGVDWRKQLMKCLAPPKASDG